MAYDAYTIRAAMRKRERRADLWLGGRESSGIRKLLPLGSFK
jgi:hypothetical protein